MLALEGRETNGGSGGPRTPDAVCRETKGEVSERVRKRTLSDRERWGMVRSDIWHQLLAALVKGIVVMMFAAVGM